jgi:hypothetical protein
MYVCVTGQPLVASTSSPIVCRYRSDRTYSTYPLPLPHLTACSASYMPHRMLSLDLVGLPPKLVLLFCSDQSRLVAC